MKIFSPELDSILTGTPATTDPVLMLDANDNVIRGTISGGGTTINPTDNAIPIRSDATTFVDSLITQVTGTGFNLTPATPFTGISHNNFADVFNAGDTSDFQLATGVNGADADSDTGGAAWDTIQTMRGNQAAATGFWGNGNQSSQPPTAAPFGSNIIFFISNTQYGVYTLDSSNGLSNLNLTHQESMGVIPALGTTFTIGVVEMETFTQVGGDFTVTGKTTLDTSLTTILRGVAGVVTDSLITQSGGIVNTPTCTDGTLISGVIESGSDGNSGYRFYSTGATIIQSGTDIATTEVGTMEIASDGFPAANPFVQSALQTPILVAGGFNSGNLDPSTTSTRNAPADFTAFPVSMTQTTPNALEVIVLVSSIFQNGSNVFIGGTGPVATAGPLTGSTTARLFQASDFTTSTGIYRRESESAAADWRVGCTLNQTSPTLITIASSLDVAGVSTTTPGTTSTFSMDFGAGAATALQTTVGFRLTGFGTDGSAAGGLAQFLNDNNIQSGDDIFITGTGTSGGTGTFRFLEFPFAPGNLNSVVFDGYRADGQPTEASDTVAGGLNPSVGVTAFQDEISNSTTQTVTYTSAASTTTEGGNLTVASGVFLNNLPTSDPGVTGQVWNNAGVLNISL